MPRPSVLPFLTAKKHKWLDKKSISVLDIIMVHKNQAVNTCYALPRMWALFVISDGQPNALISSRDFCKTS